jgi:hypothetical protein
MVEQQPGIFREVSNDVDAIEERTKASSGRFPWRCQWRFLRSRWALTYIQNWTLAQASTFLVIIITPVIIS